MKARLLILIILVFSFEGSAQLKEPSSDPGFNPLSAQTEESIDDAADVKLRPSPFKVVEKDDDDAPQKPPAKISRDDANTKFTVTTFRMETSRSTFHGIQLLSPQHNSTYTPGVIAFSWKVLVSTKKKKAVVLKVERLDGKKKYSRKVFNEKKLLDLSPGDYKWQVEAEKSAQASRWRLFKVIGMKSHSITDLYNGKTPDGKKTSVKKVTPLVSDYIIDLDGPDKDIDEEDHSRVPTSSQEPLPAPNWIKRHPSAPTS